MNLGVSLVRMGSSLSKYFLLNLSPCGFFNHDGVIFFCFYQNGVHLKKITNLGKSCLIGTTSYAEVVLIRHDFCQVILKSCQLGTTSALSYWSRANLSRLLPRHIEVVPIWHDFCHVIIFFKILLFIYWVVSYVIKINLIHNFLRVLVLKNKKLDNCVWIMFELNE